MTAKTLKIQLTKAFLLSLLAVLGFGLVTILVLGQKVADFDTAIINSVQQRESPTLTAIMKFFTFIGSTPAVLGLSVIILYLLYKYLHHRIECVLFLAVMAGAAALNQLLKMIFHRPRPDLHRLIEITGYSFPSGHSMSAFAMYGVLTFLLWRHVPTRWGRALIVLLGIAMTLMIGISRIYLGVHYPSDVIGGYLAGGFWLGASIWVYQWLAERGMSPQVQPR
ncbi:phosphatase PAP2 family protein [Tumebacillus flagellatus]|uniref:Phosphatidic acid phosphatase type 2/haloperoxidase domain-containing protein n=1 Tax=Tumebacillus flagellatus TaxID=1157490 RepID=A0A074LUB7_9BACL|nr:phosphatase PAP2 family protein [Tumebacillus flagellatus]KEO84160.1 hypothetical protein EL26_06755 [Tumebacillus flagellatus]